MQDHLSTVKKNKTFADVAESKLLDELRSLRTEFESGRRESKKNLNDTTGSYYESQTRCAKFQNGNVQYHTENWQSSSSVDGVKIEKATVDRTLSGFQYDYDDALAKEEEASDAFKKLRSSVEEVCRQAEIFLRKVSTYNDWFKMDLHESVGAFFPHSRNAAR